MIQMQATPKPLCSETTTNLFLGKKWNPQSTTYFWRRPEQDVLQQKIKNNDEHLCTEYIENIYNSEDCRIMDSEKACIHVFGFGPQHPLTAVQDANSLVCLRQNLRFIFNIYIHNSLHFVQIDYR